MNELIESNEWVKLYMFKAHFGKVVFLFFFFFLSRTDNSNLESNCPLK